MEAALITCGRQTDKQIDTRTLRIQHCRCRSPLQEHALSKTGEICAPIWNTRIFEMWCCGDLMPCLMGLIVNSYCLLKIQISYSDTCILFQSYHNKGAEQHSRKSKADTSLNMH
jgi:hypothetical protein